MLFIIQHIYVWFTCAQIAPNISFWKVKEEACTPILSRIVDISDDIKQGVLALKLTHSIST